jgi:serine/threonine protein kinase
MIIHFLLLICNNYLIVKLSDFGNSIYDVHMERVNSESYLTQKPFPSIPPRVSPHRIQTRQYRLFFVCIYLCISSFFIRSPEAIIGSYYTTKCDIFSLGCLVFELLTGNVLFDPKSFDEREMWRKHPAYSSSWSAREDARVVYFFVVDVSIYVVCS